MIKTFFYQMGLAVKETLNAKGKTSLNECAYALSFQLLMMILWFLMMIGRPFIDFNGVIDIIYYSVVGYLCLSSLTFITLMMRRFRDSKISIVTVCIIPVALILMILAMSPVGKAWLGQIQIMLTILIFFMSHLYVSMLLIMPSSNE